MMPTNLGDLRHEIDRLFEDWTSPFNGNLFRPAAFPAVNVWEDAENFYAEAELPGVTMEDLEVNVVGDELSIKGTRKPMPEGAYTYHRQERGTGEFTRFVTLPALVDAAKVEAVLQDGVLTVTLPKAEEAKPKRIQVKVN
jgi:HSP20 family protein